MPVKLAEIDRRRLIEALERGAAEFRQSLEGVSPAQATFKPSPDSWSILQCAEHVALAEASMRGGLINAIDVAEPSDGARDEAFWRGGTYRAKPFPAPTDILPPGTATLAEAATAFADERGTSMALMDSADWDARWRLVTHLVGKIDAYQCLILMSQHPARHALQIAEIKGHPDYPKE